MNVLVTGGAGFIGSHIVERHLDLGDNVRVLDNLSTGDIRLMKEHEGEPNFEFRNGDVTDLMDCFDAMTDIDMVYHFAARSKVNDDVPREMMRTNTIGTLNVLESMRKRNVTDLVFASSSTVYGNAKEIPTPEEYGNKFPISVYGSSKLAAESLISAYATQHGIRSWIFRFANVVGERQQKGVVYDFVQKLRKNPKTLQVLGDGFQKKSYVHIRDCMNAMGLCMKRAKSNLNVFNVGSEDSITVREVAETVIDAMGLEDVRIRYGNEGAGWKGDVPDMRLSIKKLNKFGFKYLDSRNAIEYTTMRLNKSLDEQGNA